MENPKIRFKGFTKDWEQRKVSELCSISTGKSNTQDKVEDGEYPFYVRSPIIERSTKYLYDEEAVLTVGDGVGTGKVFHYVNGKYDLHQRCYRMYDFTDELNAHYFYHTFSKLFYKRVMAMTAKTSVDSVRLEMIADMEIPVPKIDEQIKIGAYFDNLDHLITLHQRKCEQTKKLKKYMLQKMFSQNGAKVPEIRFYGFTYDWEQRKVSQIGNIITGSTPKTSISDNYGGDFLFVSPADIQGNRYVDETITTLTKKGFDQGRKIRERASLFVSIGSTIGKVAQTSQESTTNQQINAIEPYDNFDDDFIFTSLENISGSIKAIASNQAVPIVNKTTFGKTEIQVPLELAEQQKIGAYFRNIDYLITLHQRKCDELKKMKKYMLQNMFI